ncbi:hypothetical protein [Streptomyces sp. LARHCF252]
MGDALPSVGDLPLGDRVGGGIGRLVLDLVLDLVLALVLVVRDGFGGGGRIHVSDFDPVRFADVADGQSGAVLEDVTVDCHGEDAGQTRRLIHVRVVSQLASQDLQCVRNASPQVSGGVEHMRGASTFTTWISLLVGGERWHSRSRTPRVHRRSEHAISCAGGQRAVEPSPTAWPTK